MSVSLSRLERGTPPPRSKSCAACIQAKRRCDRSLPRCARCAHRQLACEYPSKAPAARRVARRPPSKATTARPADPDSCTESIAATSYLAPELGAAMTGERDGAQSSAAELQVDAASGTLSTTEYLIFEDWEAPEFSGSFNDDPLSGIRLDGIDFAMNLPSADYDPPASLVDIETQSSLQLVPPRGFDLETIIERMECNLSYAIDQIKNAPRMMLLETQTPWSHASLYKRSMPRVMLGK